MMQGVLSIIGAIVAVLALAGGPLGVYVYMREKQVKTETVVEELRGVVVELKSKQTKTDETTSAALATLRREMIDEMRRETDRLIEEMRREDGRISTTDGARDDEVRRQLHTITAKLDKMSSKVDQNHGMLWALVRHTKASDPRFQIPSVMMQSVDEP